jgi:hypothetical protein
MTALDIERELPPCPFCGETCIEGPRPEHIENAPGYAYTVYNVGHANLSSKGPKCVAWVSAESKEEAIERWNRRATAAKRASQPVPSGGDGQVERLKAAVEGECDGLAITDAQANAILAYVFAAHISGQGGEDAEPFLWESTTICYTKYITDSRYKRLRPSYQKWYRPICQKCSAVPVEDGEDVLSIQIDNIRKAIEDYYRALNARQHGGVAMDRAFRAIECEMGMGWYLWDQAERAAIAAKGSDQ